MTDRQLDRIRWGIATDFGPDAEWDDDDHGLGCDGPLNCVCTDDNATYGDEETIQ